MDNVSFHNRFFNLFVNVGNRLSTFDNFSRVNIVLFHKGIVIVLKVNSGWVFQLDSFIDWFYTCVSRSLDFFTSFVHEFLNDVSFHYRFFDRFFYFLVNVGNGLSTFDNLSRVYLILFHEGIIVVFKVDGHWVFQFDSFINRFHTSICRSFDFFTRFVHEFLDNISFHNWFFNRFLNWFLNLLIDVGNCLSPFDDLSRIHLVLFYKSIIIVFEVNSGWMFQFDGFINWFYACIRRSLDFFTGFVHEFLDNVSFHNRFFNFFVDIGNRLCAFNNLRWICLVLSHKGIVIILKVNGSWVFQLDSFINWFYSSICRSLDFFAGFVHEFLYDVSFRLYFFIEVGNGFAECIWDFSRIHLVLTGKLISFSFELNGLRMRQAECFTNRFHTCIRLWSQFLIGSLFLEQLTNGTFRIG